MKCSLRASTSVYTLKDSNFSASSGPSPFQRVFWGIYGGGEVGDRSVPRHLLTCLPGHYWKEGDIQA